MIYKRFSFIVATILAATAWTFSATAQQDDFDIDRFVETPVIKNDKVKKKVQDYQEEVSIKLARDKEKYLVETTRDDEVIVVTLLAERLFDNNSTVLTDQGKNHLKPLLPYFKNPSFYKVLMIMHTDNTGSDQYLLDFSFERIKAIDAWVQTNCNNERIEAIAVGSEEPVAPNNSMENRRNNRRLEVYLIPGEGMLEQAKNGKININRR